MKAALLLSGGLDSAVLAASLLYARHRVVPISASYGQPHEERERRAALAVARALGLPSPVPLQLPQLGGMETIPDGHYTDESMKATVVPNRNMVLLSHAGSIALRTGCDAVAYAAHAGDHAIYVDCRPEFAKAMELAFAVIGLQLHAPFLGWTKDRIVRHGATLDTPFGLTWSCYRGGVAHCGTCGTCFERREAFLLANVKDPTTYINP